MVGVKCKQDPAPPYVLDVRANESGIGEMEDRYESAINLRRIKDLSKRLKVSS